MLGELNILILQVQSCASFRQLSQFESAQSVPFFMKSCIQGEFLTRTNVLTEEYLKKINLF